MESRREQIPRYGNSFKILERLTHTLSRHQKTHDYTRYQNGIDYVLEFINHSKSQGYMTGQGNRIRLGDCLLLRLESVSVEYRVEEIQYYADPPDMWIALLSNTNLI